MNTKQILLALSILGTATSCEKHAERAELKNSNDTLSYSLGYTKGVAIAQSLSREIVSGDSIVNKDIMIAGFINGLKGDEKNSQLTEEEAKKVIQEYFKDIELRRAMSENEAFLKTKQKNEDYMAERAKEPGMKSLPLPEKYTGPAVLVKVIEPGKGDFITEEDFVYATFSAKKTDGQYLFNFSEDPRMLPVKGLVRGLKQAICSLKPGATATIVVPSDLAYGRQAVNNIPANSIIEYELSISKVFHKEIEARAYWKQEREKRAKQMKADSTASKSAEATK